MRCLLLIALLSVLVAVPMVSASGAEFAEFLDAAGNVRAEPATSAKIVRTPPQGTQVTVLETQGKWRKIRFADGVEGWCHQINLKAVPVLKAAGDLMAFLDDEGNVRKGPGSKHPILIVPPKGTVVEVIGSDGKWLKIRFGDGIEGWCHVSNLGPVAAADPAGTPEPGDRLEQSPLEIDLTGDGKRERIVLRRYQMRNNDPDDADYFLRVYAGTPKGAVLWEDAAHKQSFYLGHAGMEVLQLAGDIDGDGVIELVSPRAQSDVSPCCFRVYEWRNGAFLPKTEGFLVALHATVDSSREFLWGQAELPDFQGLCWISQFLSCDQAGVVSAAVVAQIESGMLFGEATFRGSPEGFSLTAWTKPLAPMTDTEDAD